MNDIPAPSRYSGDPQNSFKALTPGYAWASWDFPCGYSLAASFRSTQDEPVVYLTVYRRSAEGVLHGVILPFLTFLPGSKPLLRLFDALVAGDTELVLRLATQREPDPCIEGP